MLVDPSLSAAALAALLLAAPPSASGAAVRIDFEAPAGCADESAFFEALRARSERVRLAAEGEDALTVEVRLTRVGSKVRGELRVAERGGESDVRRVEGGSCDEVVSVLSLTAALALERLAPPSRAASQRPDGDENAPSTKQSAETNPKTSPDENAPNPDAGGTSRPAPSKSEPHAGPAARPKTGSSAGPRGASESKAPSALALELGAEAAVSEIVSPLVALGGGVFVRVNERRSLGTTFAVGLFYLSNAIADSGSDVAARALLVTLQGCPLRVRSASGSLWVEPCVLAEGGRLAVSDSALDNPREARRFFSSVGVLGRAGILLSRNITLQLEAALSVPFVKRHFVSENPEHSIAETPAISPLAAVGVAFDL